MEPGLLITYSFASLIFLIFINSFKIEAPPIFPVRSVMRLLGKDLINLKYNNNKSYWIEKKGPKSKMKNQF